MERIDQPNFAPRIITSEALRYAKQLAAEYQQFLNKEDAWENGRQQAQLMDAWVSQEGIFGQTVSISGPSVVVPEIQQNFEDKQLVIKGRFIGNDPDLAPYESAYGAFYGFDTVIDTVEHDGQKKYSPALVYVVKSLQSLEFPQGTYVPSYYGRVTDTELQFVSDAMAVETSDDITTLVENRKSVPIEDASEIAYFLRSFDQPLSAGSFKLMLESIESLALIQIDESNKSQIDSLLGLFWRKLADAQGSVHLSAPGFYIINNIEQASQSIQYCQDSENPGSNVMPYVGVCRMFVIAPKIDLFVTSNGVSAEIDRKTPKVYAVFNNPDPAEPPAYIALSDLQISFKED